MKRCRKHNDARPLPIRLGAGPRRCSPVRSSSAKRWAAVQRHLQHPSQRGFNVMTEAVVSAAFVQPPIPSLTAPSPGPALAPRLCPRCCSSRWRTLCASSVDGRGGPSQTTACATLHPPPPPPPSPHHQVCSPRVSGISQAPLGSTNLRSASLSPSRSPIRPSALS